MVRVAPVGLMTKYKLPIQLIPNQPLVDLVIDVTKPRLQPPEASFCFLPGVQLPIIHLN